MKYLRKFNSVQEMNTALANSTIGILGLAYNNGTPVMDVKPTPIPNDEIWYTSTDGNIIEVDTSEFEPLTVVSHTYTGGKGVIKLSGEITTFGLGFYEQTKLKTITMPDSITSIGEEAFYGCTGLTSITIPNSVTSIGKSAFEQCTGLTSITIGSGVTTIGENTFFGCSGLTSITIPNSVTTIGNTAFTNCTNLTSVTIPSSVTSIGSEAFTYCENLTSITVDSNNSVYDSRNNCNAVIQTSTNTLIIGCKNTVIPSSVTTIGSAAFYFSTNLTSITIPSSVTSIGGSAFGGCWRLTSVTIPSSVTSIGFQAFYDVPNIIYNGSAASSSWGAKAVNGCVDGDFVYTDNTKTNLVAYVGNGGSIIIPDTVTTLDRDIFRHVTVTSITFGNNVSEIPQYMFNKKVDLTSVTINNGIVGEFSFLKCANLTSLIIGNGVTSIGNASFGLCTSLTSITIPSSVTSIGNGAFRNCSGLTSITCNATTPPVLSTKSFDNTNDCPIYVPSSSVDTYKAAEGWSAYASRIQAMQS